MPVRLLTVSARLDCQERVARRVLEGGHDVPAALIQHRYASSLSLLKRNYRLFDRLQLYDNSGEEPIEILEFIPGNPLRFFDRMPQWAASIVAHITRMEALYAKLTTK